MTARGRGHNSKNMTPLVRTCILLASFLALCNSQAFDAPDKEDECKGAVTLYEGSETTSLTQDEDNIKVTVDRVKLEGCGCFTLHSRKNGRGKSFFLGQAGDFSKEEVGLTKVRSVRRVGCDRRAMPVWSVILLVVGLIIITGVVAVCCFRKYREYMQVKTGETSTESV